MINSSGHFMFQAMIDTTVGKTNTIVTEYNTNGQLDSLVTSVVPDSGVYYHLAVTLDPNTYVCTFYINGIVAGTKTMKGPLHYAMDDGNNPSNQGSTNEFDAAIGARTYYIFNGTIATNFYFKGYIDDVVEAGFALNKSQIDTIAAGNDLKETPFMNFHFNEGVGSTAFSNPSTVWNNFGYGNTGYLSGVYSWQNCVNPKPIANSGPSQLVTMPTTNTILDGTASAATAAGETISSYAWNQTSGPAPATIVNSGNASTIVNGLQIGTYTFELTVTDNYGQTDAASVQVTVQRAWANTSDSLALTNLYSSTGGPNWFARWPLTLPVINWSGVTISSDSGRVTRVLLNTNNLRGTIPARFDSLPDLLALDIGNNSLTFSGMELLAKNYGAFAIYAPQVKFNIRIDSTRGTFYADSAYGTLGIDTFRWYMNGVLTATIPANAAFTPTDTGTYYVAVTNALANKLTLYSKEIRNPGRAPYITVAGLRVYADNIPPGNTNPRTVSGNVRIVPANGCTGNTGGLHLDGNIVVDSVLNTISGSDKIYCINVGTRGTVNLPYFNNYKFFAVNDILTWTYDPSSTVFRQLFNLAVLNVGINSMQVLCDGVMIKGQLSLPKWVYILNKGLDSKTTNITIDSLFVGKDGIKYSGSVNVSGLTYRGLWGLDKLGLKYDYITDQFSVDVRLLAYLFNFNASATIIKSLLDEINFGIAAGAKPIPLPVLFGFAVDSVGGGVKNLSDSLQAKEWTLGARLAPYAFGFTFPSLANLTLTGTYQCGTSFSGKSAFHLLGVADVTGETSYRKNVIKLSADADLHFSGLELNGNADLAISTNQGIGSLKGTLNITAKVDTFKSVWLQFFNKYITQQQYAAIAYVSKDYVAGSVQLGKFIPRLYYINKSENGWSPQFSLNIAVLPLEVRSDLKLGMAPSEKRGKPATLGDGGPATSYSFSVTAPTENIVVSAKGKAPPTLSMYLTNGDSLNAANYGRHPNVLYNVDMPNGITSYIVSNPPQGIYYAWSPNADSLHVSQFAIAPQVIITKVVNDPLARRLSVTYIATAQNNKAYLLFGLDDDGARTDGIVLQDSVPITGSSGTISLDYSAMPSGVYNLYAIITDSIGQSNHFYYNQSYKLLAQSPPAPPSAFQVTPTDSSLIFHLSPPGPGAYDYLIHYQSDTGQVTLNSPNLAIGDTNAIEITNFPPGKLYQFAVSALDTNSNESDLSNIVTISWKSTLINNFPTFSRSNNLYKVKAGSTFNAAFPATDPDGDPLAYAINAGPSNAHISASGTITWVTSLDDAGYHRIQMKVSDGRGGADSITVTVLVYNASMAAPSVTFNKPSFESYTETATVDVADLMAIGQNNAMLQVYSTSDPTGITVQAYKVGDEASWFRANIILTSVTSNGNSIKVNKGDTIWARYTNASSSLSSTNYSLFRYIKADFLFNDSICVTDTAKFFSSSKGANLIYNWNFGDGGTSMAVDPTHQFQGNSQQSQFKVTLIVTNSLGQSDTTSKFFHLNPSPVINLTALGPLTICSGDTITLSASNSGDSLTWYHNDTLIAGATLSHLDITAVTQSGSYFVLAKNVSGCIGRSSAIDALVNPIPQAPLISLYDDTLVSGTTSGNQWYINDSLVAGATGATYVAQRPGEYTATVTVNGCASPLSDSVLITSTQKNRLIINGDTLSCLGTKTYNCNEIAGATIVWTVSPGNTLRSKDTTATVTWSAEGGGTVTAKALINGISVATATIIVHVTNSNPERPLITLQNSLLVSSADSGNTWYRNDTLIAGANSNTYTPVDSGNYTAQVTIGGCMSPMSDPYHFTLAGASSPVVQVLPNPAINEITVFNRSSNPYSIRIFDIKGNVAMGKEHVIGAQELQLSALATGVYVVVITDEVTRVQIRVKILKLMR
jgi:hypothetical protein